MACYGLGCGSAERAPERGIASDIFCFSVLAFGLSQRHFMGVGIHASGEEVAVVLLTVSTSLISSRRRAPGHDLWGVRNLLMRCIPSRRRQDVTLAF